MYVAGIFERNLPETWTGMWNRLRATYTQSVPNTGLQRGHRLKYIAEAGSVIEDRLAGQGSQNLFLAIKCLSPYHILAY